MTTYSSVRDILVVVAQRERTRWGLLGRWTLLSDNFHNSNVLLVSVALAKGLLVYDGGHGLRLTRRGRALLALPPRTTT